MSQEVDERVVEMRFDNAQFERNTRQSIKTLNELNESLKLEGAEKGFEKIDDAAAKVDFDRMESALDSLNSKFSAVEVMGVTALVRITNQAIDTGERLVKSLSVDQVASGWNKYAQKTASVQTIMNATGKSIAKVNGYLEKLMWFSDETSYGFTDMTSALSTLTSTGGDIEKMIPMIMGMANATAYAGKGAAEFQRVIYNLAQSYGTGAIQLIDWKSVEQAGVASQQLKQLLIDTGVELGKIKKGAVTTGSFDNSLQKKWADREVMEKAFGKYAEFAEAVKAELDANPNKYHNQASLAIEAIADQYDEVTVKAFKAAQEAKSFSEAVDATKDAVSSGWMETFDILFGNYEEAKGFWSDLAEEFWTMFAGGAAGRNNWLKSAFDSGLDQLLGTDGFGEAGDNYTQLLEKSLVKTGLLTEDAVTEAGSFQKALEESGVTAEQLGDVIRYSANGYADLLKLSDAELKKHKLSREGVQKIANAYASMAEKIQNGSVNLDDLAGKMNQLSGREHFFNGILNILDGINSVLTPMRDAFGEVFMTDGSPLYNFLKGFDELTGKMQLSEGTAEKVQKVFKGFFSVLNTGFKALKIAAKTAFAILEKLLDILSPATNLLLNVGSAIGNVLTWVDQSMGQAESLTDVIAILIGAIAALVSPLGEVWQGFKSIVRGGSVDEAKQQFGAFGAIVNTVGGVLDKFKIGSVSASGIIGKAVTVLGGIFMMAFDGVGALIGSAFSGFNDAGKKVEEFKDEHVPVLENIRDTVLSIPEKATEVLADFGGTLSGIMSNISGACRNALEAVKNFFDLQDGVDIYRLLALIDVGALAAAIYGATVLLKKASDNFKNTLANPIGDFFKSLTGAVNTWTKAHTTNNLATAAKAIATAVALISGSMYLLAKIDDPTRAVQALASVISELFSMVVALKVLAATDLTGLDTAKLIGTIVAISIGMASLAGVFTKMGSMHTYQVENGLNAISRVAAVLMSMIGILTILNTYGDGTKGAGAFVAAAAAVDAIALALIPLAKAEANGLDIDGAVEAINGVAIAMSILMVASGFAQKLAGKADVSTLDKIVKYLVKLGGMLIAINAMGTALLMAAGAVAIFASLGDRMMDGIRGAGLVLSGIAGLLVLLASTKVNPLRMQKAAASVVIASASLLILAEAVKKMGKAMRGDEGGAGFAGISLGLIELSAAMYLLGKNAVESTAAAVAMVAMGAALMEMAVAIKMLADVEPGGLAKGIITMAAALGVLAAGIGWLSASATGIVSLAGACLMLATALLILTPAFKGLASLTAGEAFAGVISMIGLMIGLFAIGSITPVAAGMVVLSACMISLAKAFSIFAGGIIKLSIATAILTILAAFAGPLREVIVTAADDIEAALTAIITAICNTITNCEEPLEAAIVSLCKILIQSIVDLIGWAWDGNGEGGGVKGALDELWANFLAWADEHASELSKQFNPFDLSGWVDTFTASDRPIGMVLNGITDPFLAPFGTSLDELGNRLEDKIQGVGENLPEGLANGIEANTGVSDGASADMGQNAVDAAAEAAGVQSPSWKTFEIGNYMAQGLANGLTAPESLDAVTSAAAALSNAAETNFRDFWGIHSPSTVMEGLAEYIPEGFKAGLTGTEGAAAIGYGISGMISNASSWLDKLFPGMLNKAKDYGGQIQNALTGSKEYQGRPGFDEWYQNELSTYTKTNLKGAKNSGLTIDDLIEAAQEDDNPTGSGGSGTGKTKKSSGTKKTLAQKIAEKYKTRLEANKALRETLDSEYELWQVENQYSADADTLLSKKMENAAAEIANQTDRVAIAQAKYDELYSKWGADKQETKEAYADLLSEKVNLAKLKADQYTNLFEEVTKRYDTDLDTLEKQYGLWTAQNDGTATKLDKIERETQYQKDELAIKQKKEEKAKEQWETLKEKYGEEDLRTKEAWNDYLDAQTESLEIQNEIAKQALNKLDAQIELIQNAQSRMQSKMDILSTVFDDGSLADRADAYKAAVDEYGKDSEQARKAQFQGTTSAILSTVTAMQNLNYQMQNNQKLWEKMQELEEQGKKNSDKYQQAESDLLSSQSAFIGFASNLADALNMDDTAKRAMLILANSIQKKENWQHISDAFQKVMTKVSGGMSEGMKQGFSDMFGWMTGEGMDIETEFVSTISSALQGDWAGAFASALAFGMDLAFSEAGQNAMNWAKNDLLPAIQNGLGSIDQAVNGTDGIAAIIGKGMQGVSTAVEGSGGITEVLGSIGTVLTEVGGTLMSFLAEFWWVFLIIGAIAAVIGGIAWYVSSKQKKQQSDPASVGEEFDKQVSTGITDGSDKVDQAVDEVTKSAVDIARDSLSTISKVMDDDYEYTPQITPVVDLSNVVDAATEANTAFEATAKAMSLDDDVTRQMAAQIETQAEIQNSLKQTSNAETLNAINALGAHMDGVAESIKGMKMTIDGRKAIGYIDAKLGQRTAAKVR